MACAGSTEIEPDQPAGAFDPGRRYRLHPQVALRPEPFGALAYHYGNRRLTFVRSHDMVHVLGMLGEFPSVDAALEGAGIDPARRPTMVAALRQLHDSEVIGGC